MSGFFSQLGPAAGQVMLATQAYDTNQADLEIKQAEAAKAKLSAQASKDVAAVIQAGVAADRSTLENPLKAAELYQKASTRALAGGSPETAAKMSAFAKGQLDIAKEQATVLASAQAVKKEALSTAADDFLVNPSQEAAVALSKAAIATGTDPTKLPKDAVGMKAFAEQSRLAALSAKDRVSHEEKVREFDQRSEENRRHHQETEVTARQNSQMLTLLRESMIDKNKATTGKVDKISSRNMDAVLGASSEVTSSLEQVLKMPASATIGAFGHLKDGSIVDALGKTGANSITPEIQQMFQSNMAGMALEVGRVITLGAGKSANDSTIKELERAIVPSQGDTEYTSMYKLATGARIVKARLEALPQEGVYPSQVEKKDKQLDVLNTFPDPAVILARAQADPRSRAQLARFNQTMGQAMKPETAGNKKDSAHPADIQAILDAQKK